MSGDDSTWLDSAPTKGDASAFLPGGGIDVQTDGVKVFSTEATGEAKDFMSSASHGMQSLLGQAGAIGPTFQEAEGFLLQHGAGTEALGMFTTDASIGIRALGQGAQTIAINYINGDTTSAATMKDVEGAFDVAGGNGLRTAPNGAGKDTTTGQDHPGSLPPPGAASHRPDYTPYDPHADKTITVGDGGYTIPGDAPNDLENIDLDDVRNTDGKFRDDLGKTGG